MRFTDKIKYNIKRIMPALIVAGAGFMSSCSKDASSDDEPQIPQHDVELKFEQGYYTEIQDDVIQKHANDPTVRHVYLTVIDNGNLWGFDQEGISILCKNMHRRINIAPQKISGRGNFRFARGYTEKSDSLWFVSKGWTVNKRLQNQK